MRDITKEELDVILENHKHWIYEDIEDWENMRASLNGVNLNHADLRGADLRYADLSDANLECADLSNTHLICANLRNADLSGSDLAGAYLSGANLKGACLVCANMCRATLNEANLSDADLKDAALVAAHLRNANLENTNLENVDLCFADLSGAKNVPYIPMVCPATGSFVGWKACRDKVLVKLFIPEDAKRSSATDRKCRCDKAIVLDIEGDDIAFSIYDHNFVYRKGETATVDNFDNDRFVECGTGIHFFITKEEAIEYSKIITRKSKKVINY